MKHSPLAPARLPRVDPSPEFIQELAATAQAHAPLTAPPPARARRTPQGTWGGVLLGLASVTAILAIGGSGVFQGEDGGTMIESHNSGATATEDFQTDSGSSSRYGDPEVGPATEPHNGVPPVSPDSAWPDPPCTFADYDLLAFVGCLLAADGQ